MVGEMGKAGVGPATAASGVLQERGMFSILITMKFRVIIEPDEDGMFVAQCPTLPGCVSQGKTREEAVANIRDAIEGYLASLKKHGDPIPPAITEEFIEVSP